MKHLFLILARTIVSIACIFAANTSSAANEYKELSATFKATVCSVPCGKPQSSNWYLWRTANRIETRVDSNQLGEIWRRDEKGRMSFVYVEPAFKRGIEYNDTDLRMVNHKRSWDKLASIVTRDDLKKVSLEGTEKFLGYSVERYAGKIENYTVQIYWIPDLQIVGKIINTYADHQITNELISLDQPTNVKPTTDDDLSNFELVDFADLGDMETKESMGWLKKVELAPGVEHHEH